MWDTTSNSHGKLIRFHESLQSRCIALELAFETKLLRELCESEEKAKRTLGANVANVLKSRLADLIAAASVKDLPLAKLHNSLGTCVFELTDGYELVTSPNHPNNPLHKSGAINWAKVERIKIIKIGLKNE